MLTTVSAFERVGGLNDSFSWAFDDVDYCMRVTSSSKLKKVAYCGNTEIYHEESASLKKNPVNKLYMNKNVAQFRKDLNGKYEIDHDKYLNNPNYNVI
jgi:GT2 family glycosyltransferase